MADVSEKHRAVAEKCTNDFRMIVDRCEGDLMEIIAAALANSEREGMKRAEAICYARSKDHHKQAKKYESEGDEDSQTQCLADAVEAMCCASDIRSEAGDA